MSADIGAIVQAAVAGLGYELVDFERTTRGLMRVFIDKPAGIAVEDCANVSNHLTRVFFVENVDFERLEVSSPGLDRPLTRLDDFRRFTGRAAKVRLNALIQNRKRFEAVIESVNGDSIGFRLLDESDEAGAKPGRRAPGKALPGKGKSNAKSSATAEVVAAGEARFEVPFANIDRARLIPEI